MRGRFYMSKFLIDRDPLSGYECWAHIDGDDVRMQYVQPVGQILDGNKAKANDEDYTKQGIKRDMWHYASIPNTVIYEWLHKHGVDFFDKNDDKKMFQLLNSPEYAYLKTTHKHHAL
jgi:hypothetical protein